MELLDKLAGHAVAWVPALGALVLSVLFVAVARRIVSRAWKGPTGHTSVMGQLLLFVLVAAAVVAVILALPIGESARAELLGVLGLLLSAAVAFSSTTFIGNAMAGLMLRAVRNFRSGDFLQVGDHFGRVSELGLLHTEIQTEDRDLTTLPNLYLVTNPVKVVRSSGTVVSATVSLGYDVHRGKVEKLLVEAAERTGLSNPFVQVAELGDYSATYRVAGLLGEVKYVLSVRASLRGQMLDALHGAGVEIVSPTFMNQRIFPERQQFIPVPDQNASVDETSFPEEKIFDKAEEAESREQVAVRLKKLAATIEVIDGMLADASDDSERAALEQKLTSLRAEQESAKQELEDRSIDE